MDDNSNTVLNSFTDNNLDIRWNNGNSNTNNIFDLDSEGVIVLIVEENISKKNLSKNKHSVLKGKLVTEQNEGEKIANNKSCEDDLFKCIKCDETFSYNNLKKDQNKNQKLLAYQCKCGELLHLENKELKKQYICKVCDKEFENQADCKKHQQSHTKEERWKCKYCLKGFKQGFALTVHLRRHTGEKPFSCTVCGRSFIKNSALNIHFRSHTGEKPHKCNTCPKSFCNRSDLVKHLRCHTGEKPYTCTCCGKAFRRNSHLRKHMIVHRNQLKT